jgi:hypothetical protein
MALLEGKNAVEEPRGTVPRAETEKAALSGQPFHHPRYIGLRDRRLSAIQTAPFPHHRVLDRLKA